MAGKKKTKETTNEKEIILIVDEKHGYPKEDLQKRLHCETGPAVRLVPEDWDGIKPLNNFQNGNPDWEGNEDGAVAYFWHGLEVPPPIAKILIENPDQITADYINKLDNIELRRVALERYGFDKYLLEIKAKVLHEEFVERVKSPAGGTVKIKQKLVQTSLKGDPDGVITGVFAPNSSPNGRFEKEEINWKPISEFPEHERGRILKKYENTGDLQERDGVLSLRQVLESGEFIPDLDVNGNYVYKMYFMPVHKEIRPFWFRRGEDGNVMLDQDGDPIQEYGDPQEPTCRNALSSTFGLYGDEYVPDVET